MSQGPGEWVEKGAFVLPVLPRGLKIDPLFASVLHCTAFLELSDDDVVDPDAAVEAMEHVAMYLSSLDAPSTTRLSEQLSRVVRHARKDKWPEDVIEFLSEFLENFGATTDDDDD